MKNVEDELRSIRHIDETHWWYTCLFSLVMTHIKQYSRGRFVLDVGCGTGRLAELLMRADFDVQGVDTNEYALELTTQRGITARYAAATSLPFLQHSFDVVVSLDVLHYLTTTELTVAFDEILRVLRPGGIAIIQVPAFNKLWSKNDDRWGTVERYSVNSFKKQIPESLFPLLISYRYFFVFPLTVLFKLWQKNMPTKESDVLLSSSSVSSSILMLLMRMENALLAKRIPLPIGSSVYVILRKDESGEPSHLPKAGGGVMVEMGGVAPPSNATRS